jgi:thiol-disulfide isomerase/thioredoxin
MHRRHKLFVLTAAILAAVFVAGCDEQAEPKANAAHVVAFTATWCEPCRQAKPALREIAAAGVRVTEIDSDTRPDLHRQYQVRSLPTFIVYDGAGEQIERTHDIDTVLKLLKLK